MHIDSLKEVHHINTTEYTSNERNFDESRSNADAIEMLVEKIMLCISRAINNPNIHLSNVKNYLNIDTFRLKNTSRLSDDTRMKLLKIFSSLQMIVNLLQSNDMFYFNKGNVIASWLFNICGITIFDNNFKPETFYSLIKKIHNNNRLTRMVINKIKTELKILLMIKNKQSATATSAAATPSRSVAVPPSRSVAAPPSRSAAAPPSRSTAATAAATPSRSVTPSRSTTPSRSAAAAPRTTIQRRVRTQHNSNDNETNNDVFTNKNLFNQSNPTGGSKKKAKKSTSKNKVKKLISKKHKLHKGPRGGKYYIKKGKKVYIKK
jgi:hypothetical protein